MYMSMTPTVTETARILSIATRGIYLGCHGHGPGPGTGLGEDHIKKLTLSSYGLDYHLSTQTCPLFSPATITTTTTSTAAAATVAHPSNIVDSTISISLDNPIVVGNVPPLAKNVPNANILKYLSPKNDDHSGICEKEFFPPRNVCDRKSLERSESKNSHVTFAPQSNLNIERTEGLPYDFDDFNCRNILDKPTVSFVKLSNIDTNTVNDRKCTKNITNKKTPDINDVNLISFTDLESTSRRMTVAISFCDGNEPCNLGMFVTENRSREVKVKTVM